MPTLSADKLIFIASQLLQEAGASEKESAIVSRHSVEANLVGHASHGIMLIPNYIDQISRGQIVPDAPFEITKETTSTMVIDGHWGFGYVVSEEAMLRTIERAKETGVASTTIRRQSHVGRLADYPIMAAQSDMIGLMTADSGRSAKSVAPFGGREPRLGTNPICIAIPSYLEGALFIDFATSAVALGKLDVAIARNEQVPEGWFLDKDGNPTQDPHKAAVVLPFGGKQGHKGYGLSVIVEILSGILTGLGFGHDPSGRHNDGCFMIAVAVEAFLPLDEFKREVTEFANYLKNTPTVKGHDQVFYPGEIEHIIKQRNLSDGVFIEDATWRELRVLAKEYGIEDLIVLE